MDTPTQNPIVQNTTQGGATPPQPLQTAPKSGGNGPLIGIIVIVLVLAAGAFYLWMDAQKALVLRENEKDRAAVPAEQAPSITDAVLDALRQTSSSDTASAIEADLNSTQIGDIDAALSQTGSQI